MADEGRAPHDLLLAVVVGVVVCAPFLLGDSNEAVIGAITDPLLLCVGLILIVRFMSSDQGTALSDIFFIRGPDFIHRVDVLPVGVILLLLVLLYNRVSLFGGGGDSLFGGGGDSND